MWYERGFSFTEYALRWTTKNRQDKDRIGAVLMGVNTIPVSVNVQEVLKEKNFDKLSELCQDIVRKVGEKYVESGTKFNKPPTISAIASKIARCKKAAK